MQWENLYYALTQLVHNFGAVAIVGGAFAAYKLSSDKLDTKHKLAWLVLIGWGAQVISGVLFGGISLYYYGETPDLHSTAEAALITKAVCATSALMLVLLYLKQAKQWNEQARQRVWLGLTILGASALIAAAFLRWFS